MIHRRIAQLHERSWITKPVPLLIGTIRRVKQVALRIRDISQVVKARSTEGWAQAQQGLEYYEQLMDEVELRGEEE